MKLLSLVSTLALASIASPSTPTYSATVLIDRATMICTLISPPAETQHHRAIKTSADVVEQTRLRQNRLPEELLVHEPYDMQQFLTVLGGSVEAVTARVTERCTNGVRADPEAEETKAVRLCGTASRSLADEAEIRKLVDSGDPLNRIDVVRMGDGYTATEKTKFYADMQRLTNEMFTGDTFAQYLPLFNIWTALVTTIDISQSYHGLEGYSQATVGLLTFVNIFSGPLLVFARASNWTKYLVNRAKNVKANPTEQIVWATLSYQAFRMAFYTIIVYFMRFHLFIWSVFAPKFLYEVVFTVVIAFYTLAL